MNEEGALRSEKSIPIGNIDLGISPLVHNELMMGYCGMISYVDSQLAQSVE